MAAFGLGEYRSAARLFEKALEQSPYMDPIPLAVVYGHLGWRERARDVIDRERAKRPSTHPVTVSTVMDGWFFRRKDDARRFVAGLRIAGL